MPELPDVTLYVDALSRRIVGETLLDAEIYHPFLLRTADPPLESAVNRRVTDVRRLAKRIVVELNGGRLLVLHLMIAGRLGWTDRRVVEESGAAERTNRAGAERTEQGGTRHGARHRGRAKYKSTLAELTFTSGRLTLTEAGSKRRAALHVLGSPEELRELDRGGIEPLEASEPDFRAALLAENHTLKRALTDQRLIAGIGNAYSDEILHRARLSPFKQTQSLGEDELSRLYGATQAVLSEWLHTLREQFGERFPDKVTAFRPEMAVHGKYGKPCPVCGDPVQRIQYADNECNYCATCQTEGRLLADRALSRLLKSDWPRTIGELEERGSSL